ncbi:MAG: hypothetical protein Kow0020_00890 [Wenzhouxiangellaceae bacterium]
MRFSTPDPAYTSSAKAAANFRLALRLAVYFVLLLWLVFFIDRLADLGLSRLGVAPRSAGGLIGILAAPLLHADLGHIASNSVPLLLGLTLMLYLFPHASARALPVLYLGPGLLVWLIGRPSVHIGASGLIYGVLGFVFASGLLKRDLRSAAAALVVWFMYSSMLWGVLPGRERISWEFHAAGLALGVLMAILYRDLDRPPTKRYSWEDEADPDDGDHDAPWRDPAFDPESVDDAESTWRE